MTSAARLVSIAILVAACKPTTASQAPDASPDAPTSSPANDDEPAPGAPREPPACAADGTPWNGKPGTCFYEHGGCCYPTPEAMCEAAGCDTGRCVIMESSPAQARCTEPAPTS